MIKVFESLILHRINWISKIRIKETFILTLVCMIEERMGDISSPKYWLENYRVLCIAAMMTMIVYF